MQNICIYLRKSRADEESERHGEGETLSKHRDILMKFASNQKLNITKIYQEVASGESLLHRPEMLQLLKDIENNMYNAVLVMDVDRLGRGNMQEQGLILETFKQADTKIITPRKTYDLTDEFDEEYSEFEAFMARKELKMINRRLQRGRLKSIEDGNYLGTYAPFGYKTEGSGCNRTLVPDEDNAPIVALIFKLYTNGLGGTKVADKLNSMGYKSATGINWTSHAVINVIKNPIYMGKVTWQKKEYTPTTENITNVVVKLLPKDQWIVVDGKHEPIISEEIFKKAEAILSSRYHTPYGKNFVNPLAGLIMCGRCNGSMIYRTYTNGDDPAIMCYKCKENRSSKFKYVEERLLNNLEEWVVQYKSEIEQFESTPSKLDDMVKLYENSIKSLESELLNLEKQKNSLHDFLERGIYDVDTYLDRSKHVSDRIQSAQEEIENSSSLLKQEEQKQMATNTIIPEIEQALLIYRKIESPEHKNKLLKSIIDHAVYTKEKNQRNDNFLLILHPKVPQ